MTQPESLVLRDGKVVKVKTNDIVLGDIVYLESGSIVPADLRLIETSDVKINETLSLLIDPKASVHDDNA